MLNNADWNRPQNTTVVVAAMLSMKPVHNCWNRIWHTNCEYHEKLEAIYRTPHVSRILRLLLDNEDDESLTLLSNSIIIVGKS